MNQSVVYSLVFVLCMCGQKWSPHWYSPPIFWRVHTSWADHISFSSSSPGFLIGPIGLAIEWYHIFIWLAGTVSWIWGMAIGRGSDGLIWLNQLTSLWRILVDMTFLHSLPQIHLEIRSTPIILAPERYLGFVIPSNINSRISGIGPNWYIAESRRPGCGGAYGAWNGLAKT